MTEQLPEADLLNAAERIAQEIVGAAIWHGKRCNWVGAMPEEGPRGRTTLSFRALGADPYGGSAGVGLFLAELARATGDTDCRRTALGALRHAISHVDDLLPGSELGLYAGRPGVAVTLALASQALNEPELEAAARAVAAAISPGQGADGHDLMAGHAGAVVGLLTLRVLLSDDTLLEAAVGHGEALLAGAERTDGNLCWRTRSLPAAPGLTGLSHGAAGVAVALLELAAAADATQYRDAADAAFAYERALYDRAARNWPDLRGIARGEAAVGPSFATFWCHGAPGGALARLRALELGASDELFTEARAALETTEAWVTAALESGSVNYSLCHGLAGNAEILVEGRHLLPESAVAVAHRVASAGLERYLARAMPWPSGAYGGATPCLFLGLAGIGRFYLRLAHPELPSLLLVRPTPAPTYDAPMRNGSPVPT